MKKIGLAIILAFFAMKLQAQVRIALDADSAKTQISRHIYGHFAEHLGRCIYDGIYIGDENQKIPHTQGMRNAIIAALKELQIPNLRWPGGCFADTYHWKDAIGPKSERKAIENTSWGGYREDNSFGTHEFLTLCELLGAEPYLAVNMNSGSVQEAVDWVQYTNHKNGVSYLTDLREKNGRDKPWRVTYWGIGNESWDCGGSMTADYYVNLYKSYATAMTSYSNTEKLFRIAVGPGWDDYTWTETVMKNIPARRIEGLSVHHYAVNWQHKSSAADFNEAEYISTMKKAWFMEEFISKNSQVMDEYDPEKRVALVVDEWGGWYDTDPGKSTLYQQNTIRDAMIAGATLNIFNNHAARVRMANLAQTVNVLQSVILTEGEKMILTPTYHVMNMYKVHQDALLVPSTITNNTDFEGIPAISVSASLDSTGNLNISLCNVDHKNAKDIHIDLKGFSARSVTGKILTSAKLQDHNTFERPNQVLSTTFDGAKLSPSGLDLRIDSKAVIVLQLKK